MDLQREARRFRRHRFPHRPPHVRRKRSRTLCCGGPDPQTVAVAKNVPVPGGFRLSAEIRHRQVCRIQISSTASATLRLVPGFTGSWTLDGVPQDGPALTLTATPGQHHILIST